MIAKEPESEENAISSPGPITNFLFGIVLFRSKFCYKSRGLWNFSKISDGISPKTPNWLYLLGAQLCVT